ncbi:hypothetical protein [Pseudanabaena yagii]|uniref:Glycosyltransferase family 2 protein n=1 Tax=Pseudanabaena yagii GIHE-NHR1 TaxID=2722753 RepID=A0ABX1LW66_9CYAN|nr:hypothetical protein [Pseudanabaena yagii]NMF60427.1 hypothetical protein [Pseudanabaena yagii GIHE-NHR1]
MNDVTLQINLSPGDINYVNLTVPYLVKSHRENVHEVLAVIDCCRPQKTKIVDPDQRFPETEFRKKVEKISSIAEELKSQGYLDRIIYLYPNNSLQSIISKKYLGNLIRETHDYGGCALMSYLAAFEVINTRYIIHYDADMLLYQAPNYDWSIEAKNIINKYPKAVAASPRISPPFNKYRNTVDAPSMHEGRQFSSVEGGWRNDWFSTRCFLMDVEKLHSYLPLIQGGQIIETLAIKYLNRGYPRSPEIMLFERLSKAGGWRLNLKSQKAWLLHPSTKPSRYIELLPQIINSVQEGKIPEPQQGYADINLAAWENFFYSIKS